MNLKQRLLFFKPLLYFLFSVLDAGQKKQRMLQDYVGLSSKSVEKLLFYQQRRVEEHNAFFLSIAPKQSFC